MATEDKMKNAIEMAVRIKDSIIELVDKLDAAEEAKDWDAAEAIREEIYSDPYSIEVRDGWYAVNGTSDGPEEFRILLAGGGPSIRLYGALEVTGYPSSVRLQCQDWFTQWTDVDTTAEEDLKLVKYCRQFSYFCP